MRLPWENLSPLFQNLQAAYIFPIIEKRLADLKTAHPGQTILNLGVGDICLPLAPAIADAISQACQEMTSTVRGYAPSGGYPFLREAVCINEYAPFGISPEEVFISDGANSDLCAILELFDQRSVVAICDPSYPLYRDATLLSGKTLVSLELNESQKFVPHPPHCGIDLVYLCTPANPTGIALTKSDLERWVAWAHEYGALLVIDNVYHAFASSVDVPPSIYAIEGAKEVAIEIRSFSKSAGFTGLRCGYTIFPKTLLEPKLYSMWVKRTEIKTNGTSYPIQRGAEACYTLEGKRQIQAQIDTYHSSGKLLREALDKLGQSYFGGVDAPYLFWKTPQGLSSWDFFDQLIDRSALLAIPGVGFGKQGEGYVRLSCFLSETLAKKAAHALHHHFCPT